MFVANDVGNRNEWSNSERRIIPKKIAKSNNIISYTVNNFKW